MIERIVCMSRLILILNRSPIFTVILKPWIFKDWNIQADHHLIEKFMSQWTIRSIKCDFGKAVTLMAELQQAGWIVGLVIDLTTWQGMNTVYIQIVFTALVDRIHLLKTKLPDEVLFCVVWDNEAIAIVLHGNPLNIRFWTSPRDHREFRREWHVQAHHDCCSSTDY